MYNIEYRLELNHVFEYSLVQQKTYNTLQHVMKTNPTNSFWCMDMDNH